MYVVLPENKRAPHHRAIWTKARRGGSQPPPSPWPSSRGGGWGRAPGEPYQLPACSPGSNWCRPETATVHIWQDKGPEMALLQVDWKQWGGGEGFSISWISSTISGCRLRLKLLGGWESCIVDIYKHEYWVASLILNKDFVTFGIMSLRTLSLKAKTWPTDSATGGTPTHQWLVKGKAQPPNPFRILRPS